MAGLPKLPGMTFADPTLSKFHRSQTFESTNGYVIPKTDYVGIGGKPLTCNSVKYIARGDSIRWDPSLTYGRTKSLPKPQFLPRYALYNQKCLKFNAFFKQSIFESPDEYFRVRPVNIIYFLEDDTITVIEPKVENCGIDQGRYLRRHKIPKTEGGVYYTWKDFQIGRDMTFYGTVFHIVNCDTFTREYLASQGIDMDEPEQMPEDPYISKRNSQKPIVSSKTPSHDDKLRRYLEYDGKILKFNAIWDDRDSEYGELRKYEVLYFLADDTISVKEVHGRNDGRDPFPLLLRRTRLPKIYMDRPVTFPSIYLETSDAEITEFYQPRDLQVGETIFILGRKMLLYDCDQFTRNYYKRGLCLEQKPAIDIREKPERVFPPNPMPPHDGFGSLEDSLQNTLTFTPHPPRKDVIRQVLNANKNLRYAMIMDSVHPEDKTRRFVLLHSLSDGTCKIIENRIENSGWIGGVYLRNTLLIKPGTDPLNPEYYTPADFYIGAVITVFKQRFIITDCDLYVYRYMVSNSSKFSCEVIENVRNLMFQKGYLNDDLEEQLREELEIEKKNERDRLAKQITETKTYMDKCLEEAEYTKGNDPEASKEILEKMQQEYEESLNHSLSGPPPHGIPKTVTTCPYPITVGDVKGPECPEDEGNFTSYTPKHEDTPEEMVEKYYSKILRDHHSVCKDGLEKVECQHVVEKSLTPPPSSTEKPMPLMVSPPDMPPGVCKPKTVRFSCEDDKHERDRYDLCCLKHKGSHKQGCDCVDYAP